MVSTIMVGAGWALVAAGSATLVLKVLVDSGVLG